MREIIFQALPQLFTLENFVFVNLGILSESFSAPYQG